MPCKWFIVPQVRIGFKFQNLFVAIVTVNAIVKWFNDEIHLCCFKWTMGVSIAGLKSSFKMSSDYLKKNLTLEERKVKGFVTPLTLSWTRGPKVLLHLRLMVSLLVLRRLFSHWFLVTVGYLHFGRCQLLIIHLKSFANLDIYSCRKDVFDVQATF